MDHFSDAVWIYQAYTQISDSRVLINNRRTKVITSRCHWWVQHYRYAWQMNEVTGVADLLGATGHSHDGNLHLNQGLDVDPCWGAHAKDQEPETGSVLLLSGHHVSVYKEWRVYESVRELHCLLFIMGLPSEALWRTPKHSWTLPYAGSHKHQSFT